MEWVSVSDRYPEDWVDVLCYCNDICSSWYEVLHWDENELKWIAQDDREVPYIVTHWFQPVPPSP